MRTNNVSKRKIGFTIVTLLGLSCSKLDEPSSLREAWDNQNAPETLLGEDISFAWNELPLTGDAETIGWSDDYWPSYRGGISYRWQERRFIYGQVDQGQLDEIDLETLSPAEKYDIFMGRYDFPTVTSELARTRVLRTVHGSPVFEPDFEIPAWFGLCHGWAAAAINFKEPAPITLRGANGVEVPFSSSDIKALLTYYQQYSGNRSTRNYFMSQRCNESFQELDEQLANGEITEEEYHRRRDQGPCKGVNAGAFHLVLANEIGVKNGHIIADVTRDAEVWNYPIHHYRSEVLAEDLPPADNAAEGTVSEIHVRTIIEFPVSTEAAWDQFPPAIRDRTYEYRLELDADGNVIGGSWISEDRPDFLWKQTKPVFRGYFRALEHIYRQSTAE